MKIKFIVDSACDVPVEMVERYGMTVLPAYVNFDGKSHADDGDGFDRVAYYEALSQMDELPSTSSMSAGEVEKALEQVFSDADHVFLVSVASNLSGIHNAMRLGARLFPADQYTLFDTETVSAAAGLQAVAGACVAEETGDPTATLDALRRARAHSVTYAAAQTLKFMRRGGRVSWATGMIGDLLRIRPVVAVRKGEVESMARARRRTAWIDAAARAIRENAPLDGLTLMHANNQHDLDELRSRISDVLPEMTHTIVVTPSVGTHVGPGTIGAGVLSAKWRA